MSVSWHTSVVSSEEERRAIYRENRDYFGEILSAYVSEARSLLAQAEPPQLLKGVLEEIQSRVEAFMQEYSYEVFNSAAHTDWVEQRLDEIKQSLLPAIRNYVAVLKGEVNDDFDLDSVKALLEAAPKEVKPLQVELQGLRQLFEEALTEMGKSEPEPERLRWYLEKLPAWARNFQQAIEKRIKEEDLRRRSQALS